MMELHYGREFYRAKAEEYPLLEEAIAGKTTLKECYARLLEDAMRTPINSWVEEAKRMPPLVSPRGHSVPASALAEFLMMLSEVHGNGVDYIAIALHQDNLPLLYDAIDDIDADIDVCFLPEYFLTDRERFDEVYPSLSEGQRREVNAQLYAFLGAGGIPSMDETQLRDYLAVLLETEGAGNGD